MMEVQVVDPVGDVFLLLEDMEVRVSSKVLSVASKVRDTSAPTTVFSR